MSEDIGTKKALHDAQQLIKAGDYEAAQRILMTVDHPTADKWLARINEMSNKQGQVVVVKEKKRGGCFRNIGIAVVTLLACFIILAILNAANEGTISTGDNPANSENSGNTQQTTNLGERSNPLPVGTVQELRTGRLRINSVRYNMSASVEAMNVFNFDPDPNEEWVLVNATFFCDLSSDEACNTQQMRFELVGDAGQAYDNRPFVDLDTPFAAEIFGGSSVTGDIGFIVSSSDSNFLLAVVQGFGSRTFFDMP